ncbi:D-beta-D-heptose 7-phosphate kinase/D-beta-D-heptose 1-phosphate adenosyltransferase [Microbacterium trichothecenolyticum]|uniref:D-glycero-beta-D-manno-heptose 1-phosphate adenylyltransferase n=1 Tax=Microbacterium trichothecenolyticum TaxID=69370 RepID=UPI00285E5712|nr:D-glycero-beta-D-manno-heptose 1-phosphate adenylyltransferase [Microbacterium trichothecenolyticum]MDR7112496.1 D-beta-D-heptose 7-phosphate kinase/D-beta-D-heptose 1-phosphate adenosyltransferase [Microbacterium trichothecenolyticum]
MSALPPITPHHVLGFETARVIVIGDAMLDRYVDGTVSRISPEAPIPVLQVRQDRSVAGGAANAAMNVAALGATTTLIASWANDESGRELERLLTQAGVAAIRVARGDASTIEKLRVVADQQQIVRVDRENTVELDEAGNASVMNALETEIANGSLSTSIVISDYAKGMIGNELAGQIISLANQRRIPVIVDPKSSDIRKYRGATVVKPNFAEAVQMTGITAAAPDDAALDAIAQRLLTDDIQSLAVSLSAVGVEVIEQSARTRIPTRARLVADVSGAGDSMISGIAVGLASGLSTVQAVQVGNMAAGIACGRPGTAVVTRVDLLNEMLIESAPEDRPGTVEDWDELARLVAVEKAAGKRVVFANGVFDLLHAGHVALLKEAKSLGDVLVVGLNSDASTARLKGPTRPLQPQTDRMAVLDAVRYVDFVTVFEQDTPRELISAIQPDVIVKGSDYRPDQVVGGDDAKAWGGRVHIVNLLDGVSTTRLSQGEQVRRG